MQVEKFVKYQINHTKNGPKTRKILSKWQNFAKSGHTAKKSKKQVRLGGKVKDSKLKLNVQCNQVLMLYDKNEHLI